MRISIHVPLAGNDLTPTDAIRKQLDFYPRPPCGERRRRSRTGSGRTTNFYPRPPCGERLILPPAFAARWNFYPRPPCGERQGCRANWTAGRQHFYPRPPCGERPAERPEAVPAGNISIHVPLAGNDSTRLSPRQKRDISIHVPLAGNDKRTVVGQIAAQKFLSTSPLRGTTVRRRGRRRQADHFYPRPPCGERPMRSPLTGTTASYFYPRPPCGERRGQRMLAVHRQNISIHVPLAGNDLGPSGVRRQTIHFYPRPPCGERREVLHWRYLTRRISIHVPLAGNDCLRRSNETDPSNFYPRPPCGERQLEHRAAHGQGHFYPRPPCGERLALVHQLRRDGKISIHVPLAGNDAARTPEAAGTT